MKQTNRGKTQILGKSKYQGKVTSSQILRQKYKNKNEQPNKNTKYRIFCDVFISKTSKAYLKILKRDLPKRTGPFLLEPNQDERVECKEWRSLHPVLVKPVQYCFHTHISV